ncbi:MAG: HpcH/HpaI aldolase [Conexibacter sp.]|nr:HpcH/HpaI aldolase [Conexibacter sp.]
MPDSSLVERAASRAPLTGTFLTLPGATAAELLAEPFDLVAIDLEHGALGPLDAQEMVLGAQAAGAYALVRLPADAHGLMATMLDAGADGVLLADVAHPQTAAAAVARVTHPPDGTRGWGPRRLTLRRRGSGVPARPALWVQIESAAGVARAAEIAAVPGVDALVVGTADLSFALGTPLDTHTPELLAAVTAVRAAATGAGVVFGVAGALDVAPPAVLAGANLLMHGTDARLCALAVDSAALWLRSAFNIDQETPLS